MHWVNIQFPAQRISYPAPAPHQVCSPKSLFPILSWDHVDTWSANISGISRFGEVA